MGWTYTGDPATSDADAVRFRTGDTDATDPLLSDEEITYLLAQQGSVTRAALYACKAIAAKFARRADMAEGPDRISASQKYKQYKELISELSDELALSAATPYAGGISIADKLTNEGDADAVKPSFTRTLHDVPAGLHNTTLTDSEDFSQ